MTRPKQQLQLQFQLRFHIKLQLLLLVLCALLQLLPTIVALPQDILVDATQLEQAPSSPALSGPSDLSAGLNLVPVSNLIAAAANAEPPAPIQFVRIAMNSGL
ncbi:uncharacterized protein LOC117793920 [Drosophila innubila]|uniref:uncharacterized protein LOC117793920 n=1 Tax=Drosophila innubila TaxID=198719 RepID=UPI00148C1AC1|nr:uncharacterized protein LOC117793920 [Drosophila innubila]